MILKLNLLSIIMPLLSFVLLFFFGNFISKFSKIITIFSLFLSVCFTIIGSFQTIFNFCILNVKFHYWLKFGNVLVESGFLFDNLSVVMIFVVCLVSLCVHVYSCYYMSTDPHLTRFLAYLSLFTFFMLFLLSSDNLIQFFCAWEGVGLCSYLLINFWFTRVEANKAALKAVFVNRIGDYALFFSIALTLFTFKTTEFCLLNSLIFAFSEQFVYFCYLKLNLIDVICFGFSIGAFCKSAQIGFHVWLPDAMEGPTPVSALIHAATMVTAGIYLICRCSFFFEFSPKFLNIFIVFGSFTALLGASTALFQYDIKKIIAYSTCSQLGYMFVACGLSRYDIALFHLINHAFFKAALFLCAGIVIHTLSGEQDIRKMGNLREKLPLVYTVMLIASFALAGIPFFAGFYSKDAILGNCLVTNSNIGFFSYFCCLLSAFLTSFYSAGLIYYIFLGRFRGSYNAFKKIHSTPILALIPVYLLAILSIISGFYLKDLMIGLGTNFFDGLFFFNIKTDLSGDFEFISSYFYKLLPISAGLSGFAFYYLKDFLKNK